MTDAKVSSTGVTAQLCLWAPYDQAWAPQMPHMIPLISFHRMELCVGMICGTIPALRPLLAPGAKTPQGHGHHEGFESYYKLTPVGRKPLNQLNSSNTTPPHFYRSTSQERTMAAHDLQHIRRTCQVEVDNEAGGGQSCRKGEPQA